MVYVNFDNVSCTKEERAAAFEFKNNISKFFVMCIIILVSWKEAIRMEGDWVKSVFKFLYKDLICSVERLANRQVYMQQSLI